MEAPTDHADGQTHGGDAAAMVDERHMGVVSWQDIYAGGRHYAVTLPQKIHRCRKFLIFSYVYTLIVVTTYYGDVMSESRNVWLSCNHFMDMSVYIDSRRLDGLREQLSSRMG